MKMTHVLSEIDPTTRDAVCQECGPTKVVKHGKHRNNTTRWVCRTGRNSQANRKGDQVARYDSREKRHGLRRSIAQRLRAQAGGCWVCGSADDLSVDHDHRTGRIRGVLCGDCNRALGLVRDSTFVLARLIEYLNQPPIDKTVQEIEQMSCAPQHEATKMIL